jgi:hypothetical protein
MIAAMTKKAIASRVKNEFDPMPQDAPALQRRMSEDDKNLGPRARRTTTAAHPESTFFE